MSSVSSPSELSDGSVSVTSAYSSASALRDSPAGSPEPEAAMDFGPPPEGWYLRDPPSPPGLRCSPHFFMDYEGAPEPELLAYGENAENEGYLPATDVLQVPGRWRRGWLGGGERLGGYAGGRAVIGGHPFSLWERKRNRGKLTGPKSLAGAEPAREPRSPGSQTPLL